MLQVQNIEKYYGSQNHGGLRLRQDHAAQLHLHH